MKPTVLVAEPIAPSGLDRLRADCTCITPWADAGSEPMYRLEEADAVIVRLCEIRETELDRAPRLRVIAKHGVGVDNIDCPAATRRKIPVAFTPTSNANAVAEHTVALLLALARQIEPAAAAVRAGRFQERIHLQGVELAGKTLGIVGLGRIGMRVAEIASAGFRMRVHAFDPALPTGGDAGPAHLEPSLEALLPQADFLTLHLPLRPDTRHLINHERLRLLKPTCRIINTSRGPIVDEGALIHALSTGMLAGAALDVFEHEPLPPDHPLLRTPRLLLTPHISGSTREALDRMSEQAAQAVLDVLQGRKPPHLANPEVWS
jgi:D-3-phosphoglycerate dehydrogenase